MRGLQRAIVKVIIFVPLAAVAAFFAVGPGQIVSYSPETRVGVHMVMAFWISIPAALAVLAFQKRPIRASVLMNSALLLAIMVHSGSAAKNLLLQVPATVERGLTDTTLDLLEFSLYAILLAGAMVCFLLTSKGRENAKRGFVLFILIIPLVLYGLVAAILPYLEQSLIESIGNTLGVFAILCYVLATILVFRHPEDEIPFDRGYFASALLLLGVATFATMLNISDPSMKWEYAETVQMASFLLVCLALAIPFLKKSGYLRRSAYGLTIGLLLIAYLPFLLTIILETMGATTIPLDSNLLAYAIIHIGAASLSGMMAILLYIYPRFELSRNHYPMVLIFGLWAAVSIIMVFIFTGFVPTLHGEPVIPFVVGSVATLALLTYAILWTLNPQLERPIPSVQRLSLVLLLLVSLVVVGEVINQIVIFFQPDIGDSPYGRLLLLALNIIIMFTFTYLIFLLAGKSKGRSSVDIYIAFFLAMWILPNILKSYYVTWSIGWWVSEILLFIGLLAGPPILIWLYVKSMHEVENSHKRANMYADLLMHDISNYNQMMMMSMELLSSDDIAEGQRKRLADDGRQVISFSEQLISNVRLLSEADRLEAGNLQATHLVSSIVSALDVFTRRIGSGELVVEFQPKDSQAFVLANDLLVHIFLNILYSALECRIRGETVTIGIHETEVEGERYWQIDIKAPGRSADQEEGYSSGTLGLLAARLMTESMKGQFSMETFARTDLCEGRLFSIR
ncbi:MAG: hypothetical protein ACFFFK_09490, partial [Candidatus Thorarchaeota archaeon]